MPIMEQLNFYIYYLSIFSHDATRITSNQVCIPSLMCLIQKVTTLVELKSLTLAQIFHSPSLFQFKRVSLAVTAFPSVLMKMLVRDIQ